MIGRATRVRKSRDVILGMVDEYIEAAGRVSLVDG